MGSRKHNNKQTRVLIGSPEEYVHGHTLSIMLTQIKNDCPRFGAPEMERQCIVFSHKFSFVASPTKPDLR